MAIQHETGESAKTPKAPKVTVEPDGRPPEMWRVKMSDLISDDRSDILQALRAKDPDHFYSYEDGRLDDDVILRKGKEIVTDDDGKVIRHESDPVVRQPLEPVMKRHIMEETLSYQALKDVTETQRDPRVFRQPKRPGQK